VQIMRVRELLRNKRGDVVTVAGDSPLSTAIRLLMQHNIGGLPVVTADGALAGFIAERDIVRALGEAPGGVETVTVRRVMRKPAPTCDAETSLHDVMQSMTRERQRHLVVMDEGRIAGVVSVGDMVKHRLEQLELEAGVLRDYVAAQRASS
jgi:CBS domain-containing protein